MELYVTRRFEHLESQVAESGYKCMAQCILTSFALSRNHVSFTCDLTHKTHGSRARAIIYPRRRQRAFLFNSS